MVEDLSWPEKIDFIDENGREEASAGWNCGWGGQSLAFSGESKLQVKLYCARGGSNKAGGAGGSIHLEEFMKPDELEP